MHKVDLFGGKHAESYSSQYASTWDEIWVPTIPSSTYASVSDFEFGFSSGIYTIDSEFLSYLMEYWDYYYIYNGDNTYSTDFYAAYDGSLLGLYGYANYYDWTNGRSSEGFGACVGTSCGGFWATAYDSSGTIEYYFYAMNFYDAAPDTSSPDVPYQYDGTDGPYSLLSPYYFRAYEVLSTGYYMQERGWNTWWRMIAASDDYAVGDWADTVAFSSATDADSNIESFIVLRDAAFDAFSTAVGAALVLGATALI